MKIEELLNAAHQVTGEYKPNENCSSGFVGAALVTKNGNVYTGVCLDFACSIGFCAEHAAIAEMLKHKEAEIEMIVAVTADNAILPPCGRCRELMYQVHQSNMDTKIVITGGKIMTLSELYPHPWNEAV